MAGNENGDDDRSIATLQFACEELRTVIDHQIDYLNDIDDKAMRTVRITIVLLGILLSATQFPEAEGFLNRWMAAGGISLLGSLISGIVVYSASYPEFGPGPGYLDDVISKPMNEMEWRLEILRSHADWMEENDSVNRRNGQILLICQGSLVLGLLLTVFGAFIGVNA